MSSIRVSTNFNIDLEFPAASFHRRLFAWLIDVIILVIYFFVIVKLLTTLNDANFFSDGSGESIGATFMLLILPLLTYHLISELTMNGQSLGKRLTGLKVVNENGGRPSISQFIIRWLIRTSDYMVVVIALSLPTGFGGNLSAFWQVGAAFCLLITDIILVNASQKGQRLGDMLAHTMLIRINEKGTINDTIFLHVREDYTPSFPQVMSLSDRDINSLKSILDVARKQHDYNLADRAADKIKYHLHIQSSVSAFDFLETLLKDYNYLSSNKET